MQLTSLKTGVAALIAACSLGPSLAGADNHTGFTTIDTAACSDIEFTPAVTSQFPEVAQACRGVVRSAAGAPYARVKAKVDYVRRDRYRGDVRAVTLAILDADGEVLRKMSTKPERGFRYTVDGKEYSPDALNKGDTLSLYLPADRWELAWSPETALPLDTTVRIEDMESILVSSTLEADDSFAFDSAELSPAGEASLDALLEAAQGYVTAITVRGYTDKIGDETYNIGLSQQRADAVKAYLVEKGVPARRITAEGRGPSNPIVDCPDLRGDAVVECLAPNRRAEIALLIPALADVANLEVTKTYRNPLGEEVVVVEELSMARLTDLSAAKDELLSACEAEIDRYCEGVDFGAGRVIGCLAGGEKSSEPYSEQCSATLAGVTDALMNRRARLDAVGQACSAELAACDDAQVRVEDKLSCVMRNEMSDSCASTMSQLTSAAF